MSTKNDGGHAFPAYFKEGAAFGEDFAQPGMTLRDWFAGQQMMRIGTGWPNEENMRLIAANCYAMADAMLKAREA